MRLRARAITGAALALALTLPVGIAVGGPASASPVVTAPAAPATGLSLAEGDESPKVVRLQKWLGITPPAGYFGPRTKAAVEALQARAGLPVTGIVDDATWAAARSAARTAADPAAATAVGAAATVPAAPAVDDVPAGDVPAGEEPAGEEPASDDEAATDDGGDGTALLRKEIIAIAASLRGIPYVAGGTTPGSGFDCSGFTSYVFRKAIGMTLPRVSRDQYAFGDPISRAEARVGDLVFMHRGGYIHHVSIYAGDGMVWHSPRPGGSVSKVPIWTSSVYFARVL